MATNMEMQVEYRTRLYFLLKLKRDNVGTVVKGLDELINMTEAAMQEEDVAYVEKKISQL